MRSTKVSLIKFFLLAAVFAFAVPEAAAQNSPQVLKVEPPNWWANHSINPVRVLIRGRNLGGASVTIAGSGLKTGIVRINQAGTYVFVDVMIDPRAAPGRRTLRINTPGGTVEAPFEISEPLSRQGRFQGFSPDDVIYLIMPDRFSDGDVNNNDSADSKGLYDRAKARYYHGGDFQGIIDRLPYLKGLGITAIWMTPVYDNVNHLNEKEQYPEVEGGPNRPITDYHGYGAVDFYGVEEHLGGAAKLKQLVDAAHQAGIKIIQDQVANHTGPYHPWVTDSPTPTWYNGTLENHLANPFQIWTIQDPRAFYELKRATLEGWFVNILPDLNQNDEDTARYLIQNTLWWVGMYGFDGIRQDTFPYVPRSFWQQWMAAIKREYPALKVVGEVYEGDSAAVSFFQGGTAQFDGIDSGVDSLFDFPTMFILRRAFAEGQPAREIVNSLARDHLYPNPEMLVTFLGNHDNQRFMNERGATVAGLKLAQTFVLTSRGIPQLFYGDEIAFRGGGDPDNRHDFPGGFSGDPRNAFTQQGRTPEQQEVFEHVRKLNALRARLEPLRRGAMLNLFVSEQQFAFARKTDRESVIVIFNNDSKPSTVEFDITPLGLDDRASLVDQLGVATGAGIQARRLKATLPAKSASILTTR